MPLLMALQYPARMSPLEDWEPARNLSPAVKA